MWEGDGDISQLWDSPPGPAKSVGRALRGPAWPAPPGAVAVRAGKGPGRAGKLQSESLYERRERVLTQPVGERLAAAGGRGGA